MTDGPVDEPDFDDPAHDRIRALLSSARVDGPVPPDVVARLDATLAGLTGREAASAPVPEEDEPALVPLRRRARLAPRLLAAAAVLVVAGAGAVGLSQVLKDDSSDRAVSADSASPATSAGGSAEHRPAQPSAGIPQLGSTALDGLNPSLSAGVPVLSTADFADARDVRVKALSKVERAAALADQTAATKRVQDRAPATGSGAAGSGGAKPAPAPPASDADARNNALSSSLRKAGQAARSCAGPHLDGVASYPIVLDGAPAVLVAHPVNAGTRLVEAWSCDGSEVLAFTTVPD